jgi:hypothetical protein
MDVIAFTTVFTLVLVSPTEPGAGSRELDEATL